MPHTLRGTITSSITGTLKHLITDDGRYTNGLEVVDFVPYTYMGCNFSYAVFRRRFVYFRDANLA